MRRFPPVTILPASGEGRIRKPPNVLKSSSRMRAEIIISRRASAIENLKNNAYPLIYPAKICGANRDFLLQDKKT
jgi:hypothetical protein